VNPLDTPSPSEGHRPGDLGPWTVAVDRVLADLGSDAVSGLTGDEARVRRGRTGPNELPTATPTPGWRRVLGHLADPVVQLLLGAIVISTVAWLIEGADGLPLDALVIAVIVVANAVIGELQERRAESALAALRAITRNEATVVRAGETVRLPAADLVPGDIIVLSSGDIVPADARLIEAAALQTAEAALTGESVPVTRSTGPVPVDTVLAERSSMVHSGTIVVGGRGRAVVTATGLDTEVGHIATLLEATEEEPTPLQREIARVGRTLGLLVVVIAVVVVAVIAATNGIRSSADLVEALLIGVSLAVAAVPEGLPAVLSVVLALGVERMSRRNALVKRLVSVEALGAATIICSDKTGTLTRNEMSVRRMLLPSGRVDVTGVGYGPDGNASVGEHDGEPTEAVLDDARWALIVGVLASDATVRADGVGWVAVGDPMEAALVAAATRLGVGNGSGGAVDRLRRSDEIPFSAERRLMSTINRVDGPDGDEGDGVVGGAVVAVKGAPDRVVDRCRWERRGGRDLAIDEDRRRWWGEAVEGLAAEGLRTLAIACRHLDGADPTGDVEEDLVLLGIVGLVDPLREEAVDAVELARRAGVKVAMITGDHPVTARRIAGELGILEPDGRVVTGTELADADDETLAELVRTSTVYARVTPEHKLRVVRALQAQGDVVAMTGDGVNDAPALKAASIGVAMGITGSDVSKEASDMVLADDDFATIVAAIQEGRAIFHNIRSFLRYLLSSNIGEVLTVFLGVVGAGVIGLTSAADGDVAVPLLAAQILWINLVTDSAPALALGVDPPGPGLMDRPPRTLGRRIIDRRMRHGIALTGITMAVATLAMLDLQLPGGLLGGPWWGSGDLATARTGAFTVLVLTQLVNTVNARSDVDSIRGRLLVNRWLVGAVALSLALQVAVVHLPWLNEPFGTAPLGPLDWLVAVVLALSVVVVSEIRKVALRRGLRRRLDADLGGR
jgi:P-type Ca2+ transporter type 2C